MSSDIGTVSAYETFGTRDPWNVDLDLEQHGGSLPDARNAVFLTDDAVQNDGDVFAFTARIYNTDPISFQIWRPVVGSTDNTFELIAYRQVIPSVKGQFENVRFSTLRVFLLIIT